MTGDHRLTGRHHACPRCGALLAEGDCTAGCAPPPVHRPVVTLQLPPDLQAQAEREAQHIRTELTDRLSMGDCTLRTH